MSRRALARSVPLLLLASITASALPEPAASQPPPASTPSPPASTPAVAPLTPDAYLSALPTYEYTPLPASIATQLRGLVENNPLMRDGVREVVVRAVTRQSEPTAVVVVVALDPGLATLAQLATDEEFVKGFGQGTELTAQKLTLAGRAVAYAEDTTKRTVQLAWQHKTLLLVTIGRDRGPVEDFVRALIGANSP